MGCASSAEDCRAAADIYARRRPATPPTNAFECVAAASGRRSTQRRRDTPCYARDKPLVECRRVSDGLASCSSRSTARRSVVGVGGCPSAFWPAASAPSPTGTGTDHPFGVSVEELGYNTTWSSFVATGPSAAGAGASADFADDGSVNDAPCLALPSFGSAYGDDEVTGIASLARSRLPVPRVA